MPKAKKKGVYPPVARVTRRTRSTHRANEPGASTSNNATASVDNAARNDAARPAAIQPSINDSVAEQMLRLQQCISDMNDSLLSIKSRVDVLSRDCENPKTAEASFEQNGVTDNIVTAHINDLTGEPDIPTTSKGSFNSIKRPVDFHVNDKIRSKIWANEYVEMASLVEHRSEPEFSVVARGQSEFRIIQQAPPKKIDHIGQWNSAFMIYLAIYCKKYPNQISNLIQYSKRVRSLASKGGDWSRYDSEFRKLRESEFNDWADTDWELWFECLTSSMSVRGNLHNKPNYQSQHSFRKQSNRPQGKKHPKGSCYKFHETGRCTRPNCSFNHTCYRCEGSHPISKCSKDRAQPPKPNPQQSGQTNK